MSICHTCACIAVMLLHVVQAGADRPAPPDNSHAPATGNTAVVKVGGQPAGEPVPWTAAGLRALWDMKALRLVPFDVQILSTRTDDGYRTDEMYFTSRMTPAGPDRVFCTFSRPEKAEPPVPAYIDLTGGRDLAGVMWLARNFRCAVLDIEWRSPDLKHHTIWAQPSSAGVFGVTERAEDNFNYMWAMAIRRGIDFLEAQPVIDPKRIACGGGSMGGWYSLLTAGLDRRVSCVFDVYAAGDGLTNTLDALSPKARAWWSAAFDPMSYARRTKAATLMFLGTNDFFFALNHGMKNYNRLSGEKRLLLVTNFNHNSGAFGQQAPDCGKSWIDHCLHGDSALPMVTEPSARGASYTWRARGPEAISRSVLCWSPGKAVWPARYWVEFPGSAHGREWEAAIPSEYAGLAADLFVTAFDARGRGVSSRLVPRAGADPATAAGPLWRNGALWDVERGATAWRLPGPGTSSAFWGQKVSPAGATGIKVTPVDPAGKISVLTNSVLLAAGHATEYRGIRLVVEGGGRPGELAVTLERNSGAWSRIAYEKHVRYGPGSTTIEVPWTEFHGPAGATTSPVPFDGLRLEGDRPRGAALTIGAIELYR